MAEPVKLDVPFKFDINTIVYTLYLLYKCNLITRDNLKMMFKIIKEPVPVDPMKYLVEESSK